MHTYTTTITWQRGDQPFVDNRYSRRHTIAFDGGVTIPGSSSPHVVRIPFSDPSAVDPEESFVASLSSCHMLTFLHVAVRRGFRIDTYTDQAEGVMTPNAAGRLMMSVVTLRPDVRFSGDRLPTDDELAAMHHEAHDECFIANSVLTDVRCEPVGVTGHPAAASLA